jgi:serine/threonine-protein kinase RsbW
MPKVELQIGAFPAHVRTARLIAAALGRRLGLDAVTIDEVKLAVGEACARAVSVHRSSTVAVPIVVEFRDDDDILEVSVLDCGPPGARMPSATANALGEAGEVDSLDADGEPAADAAESATAADLQSSVDVADLAPSLGLALIAGLVDDVSVKDRRGSDGTIVTMRWPIVTF